LEEFGGFLGGVVGGVEKSAVFTEGGFIVTGRNDFGPINFDKGCFMEGVEVGKTGAKEG
jgi:hypothetical protein